MVGKRGLLSRSPPSLPPSLPPGLSVHCFRVPSGLYHTLIGGWQQAREKKEEEEGW